MLVTLEQLKINLTTTLELIKTYIDARIRVQIEQDVSNVYAEAIITPEE